jgi:adenine-specific DNA-methyltransferase
MAAKLELNWIGKTDGFALIRDEEGKPYQVPYDDVQPRLLVRTGGYGEAGEQENILIRGENLFALKTLVKSGNAGQFRCCYIDPPYNTGKAFTHYDDALEHSLWLDMMQDHIELIYDLLAKDGSLWISIDDDEGHYLKVMCDEIFGRNNFVTNVIWQKKYAPANDAKWFSDSHDHILVYAKNKEIWRPNKLERSEESNAAYKNPDNDPRGVWKAGNYTCNKTADERPNLYYPIVHPHTGEEVLPSRTRVWAYSRERHEVNTAQNVV